MDVKVSCPDHTKTFRPIPTMRLLGTMLKNRCWSTTFFIIFQLEMLIDDVTNGWCDRSLWTFMYVEGEILSIRLLANYGCSHYSGCLFGRFLRRNLGLLFTMCI